MFAKLDCKKCEPNLVEGRRGNKRRTLPTRTMKACTSAGKWEGRPLLWFRGCVTKRQELEKQGKCYKVVCWMTTGHQLKVSISLLDVIFVSCRRTNYPNILVPGLWETCLLSYVIQCAHVPSRRDGTINKPKRAPTVRVAVFEPASVGVACV